jgi:hypothetical protein
MTPINVAMHAIVWRIYGCCTKVVSDVSAKYVDPKDASDDHDVNLPLRQRVDRIFRLHQGPSSDLVTLARMKRFPNLLVVLAHDHALRVSTGLGLSDFVCVKPLAALANGETRYFTKSSDLPPEMSSMGECQRSCIVDRDGQRRLELPAPVWHQRELHLRQDQGAVGWPGCLFMYHDAHIVGTYFADLPHRFHGDLKNALRAAGLWLLILETTLCFNLQQGPWSRAAFFQKVKTTAHDYFEQQGWSRDKIFAQLYEEITKDSDTQHLPNFGSDEHLVKTWEHCQASPIWKKKGLKVKLCRWMSYFDRAAEVLPWWNCFLLTRCVVGRAEGRHFRNRRTLKYSFPFGSHSDN